jgi:hypothetical protein
LRVPSARLELKIAKQYCAIRAAGTRSIRSVATVAAAGKHLVIDLWSDSESDDDWSDIEPGLLSALVPIRNELIAGDYRALYLALQLRAQAREVTANTRTSPLPIGTSRLTGSQQALVEFLRIDAV